MSEVEERLARFTKAVKENRYSQQDVLDLIDTLSTSLECTRVAIEGLEEHTGSSYEEMAQQNDVEILSTLPDDPDYETEDE